MSSGATGTAVIVSNYGFTGNIGPSGPVGSIGNTIYFSATGSSSSLTGFAYFTKMDGFSGTVSQTENASFFVTGVDFQLNNPIYSNDESDVIAFQACLNSSKNKVYNQNQTFNTTCTLMNSGQTITSPVYQITTSNYGNFTIAVNKWFSIKSPGSIYRFLVTGINNSTGSTAV